MERTRVYPETVEEASSLLTVCVCRGMGYVTLDAPVGHPLFGRAVPCVCRRDRQAAERARLLRRRSGMTERELEAYRFEAFMPSAATVPEGLSGHVVRRELEGIKEACMAFAADPRGWLVLTGPYGTGKTHLAYAIAAEQLRHGRAVYAASLPSMLAMLRQGYSDNSYQHLVEWVQGVAVLVLDDWGAERVTDWTRDTLYQIVDYRYRQRMPMVVTCNVHPAEDEVTDERLLSRLRDGSETRGGMTRVLTLPCADYRPRRRAA